MNPPGEHDVGGLDAAVGALRLAACSAECRACGCLRGAVRAIEQAIPSERQPPELTAAVAAARASVVETHYDCLGCDPCHASDALNAFNIGGEVCAAEPGTERPGWPPLAGAYMVLRFQASVAICTLTDRSLAEAIAAARPQEVALVGTLQTENLGIERIIRNVVANPNVRFLVVCGADSRQGVGHLPGQSLLALAQSGVDGQGRIIGAAGKRPFLRNVSPEAIQHFRRTVEVIDLLGVTDPGTVLSASRRSAAQNPGPAQPFAQLCNVPTIHGSVPPKMVPDPAGYFVIYADHRRRRLSMEHYTDEGLLDMLIEGHTAAEVYSPAVEKALVSRLDHAAYLGRELARAERSLATGQPYVQDAAPEGAASDLEAIACQPRGAQRRGTLMRKWIALAAVIGTVAVVVGVRAAHSPPTNRAEKTANTSPALLGVDDFMRNVDRYHGAVTVEGIVSVTSPDQQMFALIDRQEWDECQSVTCATLALPVRWPGTLPAAQSLVRVEGRARHMDGRLVFVGTSVNGVRAATETAPCPAP